MDDCNGDGVPNSKDPCPGIASSPSNPTPGAYHNGFQDVNCFLPLFPPAIMAGSSYPFDSNLCVPVAARAIKQPLFPVDALHPATGGLEDINGVMFVGVLNPFTTTISTTAIAPPQRRGAWVRGR